MVISTNYPVERKAKEVGGPIDLTRLHSLLFERIGAAEDTEEAVQGLLRAARELTNAVAVCFFREPPGPASPPIQSETSEKSPAEIGAVFSLLEPRLHRVFDEQRVQIIPVDAQSECHAILVPVVHVDGTTHVLAAVLRIGDEPLESFVVILQLIAGYLTLFSQRMQTTQMDWEARGAAAVLELTGRILDAPSLRAGCFEVVDLMQRFLGVQEVVVGKKLRRTSRLEAVSGQANVSPASELAGQYVAVLDEAFLKQDGSVWDVDSDRPTTEAHRQLAQSRRATSIYSASLAPLDDDASWGWIVLADRPFDANALRWLHAAGPHVAAALQAVSERRRGIRRVLSAHYRWWILGGLLLTCLFLPAPFPVSGDCVAQPMTRRFVAAPFDGTLRDTSVRPGDLVVANQVLADLDDRDLRSQLTEAIAQRSAAETRAAASLAKKEVTDAQLARLETERLTMRIDRIERYLKEIEITSPFDGIVLSGDWRQASGMPLRVGQTLFEIAPLGQMRVEVAISEYDVSWVSEGAEVDLWFDAISAAYQGKVERVWPRSEVRNGANVFLAEVSIENEQGRLRPGLRGIARVRAGTRPLGWTLLRKPWYATRRLLWW